MAKKKSKRTVSKKQKVSVKKKSVKKVLKQESEDPYFIGLDNPIELRKNILEPTREVIQFLQSYEEFKKLKEEKTNSIIRLKDDLRLIKASVNRLRKLLPKSKIKVEKEQKKAKEIQKKELVEKSSFEPIVSKVKTISPKHTSELNTLEKELGEIESQLGNLS